MTVTLEHVTLAYDSLAMEQVALRKRLKTISSTTLLLAAFLFGVALVAAACGGDKPVIKAHAWEVDSHLLNNAIFEFIVENGYGYPVETVVETTPELQEALPTGGVDLNLEGWQQNIPDWYNKHIERKNIVNLGTTFEASNQFFMIPRWVAEEYNIETVFDMQDHWQLFQDPDDPSKGVFYSCLIGQACTRINAVKLRAYGLDRYYNPVSLGSGPAVDATLARHQKTRQPVFSYYWAPNALLEAYEWQVLKEPSYNEACWEKVTEASQDQSLPSLDEACAYPTFPIDKLAHSGLKNKAPDLVEMLEKMEVGLEPLNKTLAWALQNEVTEWEKAAVYYLQTYEGRWKSWVTPKAYQKIQEALREVSLAKA